MVLRGLFLLTLGFVASVRAPTDTRDVQMRPKDKIKAKKIIFSNPNEKYLKVTERNVPYQKRAAPCVSPVSPQDRRNEYSEVIQIRRNGFSEQLKGVSFRSY